MTRLGGMTRSPSNALLILTTLLASTVVKQAQRQDFQNPRGRAAHSSFPIFSMTRYFCIRVWAQARRRYGQGCIGSTLAVAWPSLAHTTSGTVRVPDSFPLGLQLVTLSLSAGPHNLGTSYRLYVWSA